MSLSYRRAMLACTASLALAASSTAAQALPLEFDPYTRPPLPPVATTDPAEAAKVDRVAAPELKWGECFPGEEMSAVCASMNVPLDYANPTGEQYQLFMAKSPARKPESKIGTLFVNPGGPGGSAAELAMSPFFMGDELLDRFDIVGVDPRGLGGTQGAYCFKDGAEANAIQADAAEIIYPLNRAESAVFARVQRAVGQACSRPENKMLRHMSTADVARDMDVVRRAVGDSKLSFLGFSYGTELGQVYANMFPDRVRAVAVDGVIDPYDWAGNNNRDTIQDIRLWSGYGAERAMNEAIARCDAAGDKCPGGPGMRARADVVFQRLMAGNFTFVPKDPEGEPPGPVTIRLDAFGGGLLRSLYAARGANEVVGQINDLHELMMNENAKPEVGQRVAARAKALKEKAKAQRSDYPNGMDVYLGVACTDGEHPKVADAAGQVERLAKTEPIVSRVWATATMACGRDAFTARSAGAYQGPWGKRTSQPLLFIGNEWDPATYVRQAVTASKRHPGSNVILSQNWGHTAYGESRCVTKAVDAYLVNQKMPGNIKCNDSYQPFLEAPAAAGDQARKASEKPSAQEVLKPVLPWLARF